MVDKKTKNVHLSKSLHTKLKTRAAKKGTTIEKEVEEILSRSLKRKKKG